jgi:hypothetical protein
MGESPSGVVSLTQFFGGNDRGVCVQVTGDGGRDGRGQRRSWVQLTLEDAEWLADNLGAWVDARRELEAGLDPQAPKQGRQLRLEVKVPHSEPRYEWGTRVRFLFPFRNVPTLEQAREAVGVAFARHLERLAVCLSEPHPEDQDGD